MSRKGPGRHWVQFDEPDPEAVLALLAKRPACFHNEREWKDYLLDVARGTLDDKLNRKRLRSGEVPNFCSECTHGYQAQMKAAGKCLPPYPKSIPIVPAQAGAGATACPSS